MNAEGSSALSVVGLMLVYPMTVVLQQLAALIGTRYLGGPGLLHSTARVAGEFASATLPLTGAFCSPHLVRRSIVMHAGVCAAFICLAVPDLEWPRRVSLFRATRVARQAGVQAPGFTHIDASGTRLRFIAEYRSVVMITTCVAILAVDFPSVFHRSHAKTDEYGYSLMDLGTGSIVCANAVCSRAARAVKQGKVGGALLRQLAGMWPIIALGFVRLAVLSGIDYHVPTSEYGVHWNFFFTIAVLNLVSTLADLDAQSSAFIGIATLFAYQVFLSGFGGEEYILRAPREGLFSANREGILSCAGFLGIHWLSVALGGCIRLPRPGTYINHLLLWIAGGALAATAVLTAVGLPTSRRMCNLPYATFVLGVNALVLGLLAFIDLHWPRPRPRLPLAYGGVQDSMLASFLAANLLTGVVNVFLQPLLIPAGAAFLMLIGYTFGWIAPFALLHSRGVAVKFW